MSDDGSLAHSAEYLAYAYENWKQNPGSVSPDLARFFEGVDFAHERGQLLQSNADQSAADSLVYHYRSIGHRIARINPLEEPPATHPELELSRYGFTEADLGRTFSTNHIPGLESATLGELITLMRETYCGYIGVEYLHVMETNERRWLQERMETTRNHPQFPRETHFRVLWKLKKAELFEQFLHTTYRGQKRFSLEGAETVIPAVDHILEAGPDLGISEIVIGMAHRGRLNVLANILEKSYNDIFREFEENYVNEATYGDGDVKYHKGYSNDVVNSRGQKMHVSLTANPSHLEAVGPVVQGRVRAKQGLINDTTRRSILPLLLHGDAAFAGQGIVAETFNLSQLKGYRTGGTVHIVINNQVGFTTTAQDYLSGLYCTDVARMVGIPIFHVNGDHPEHVLHCMQLAIEYRQTFAKDAVVDIWCYRRHGHNEGDEPAFTQPLMYAKIQNHPSVVELYTRELADGGLPTSDEASLLAHQFELKLQEARQQVARERAALTSPKPNKNWALIRHEFNFDPVATGVPGERLMEITRRVTTVPEEFGVHRKIRKQLEDFCATVEAGGEISWANAETLAFGSLLLEGQSVRLSGEDSCRGTFSQRHAVLLDQQTAERYIPLTKLAPTQAQFSVYDSSLAEASVLAFEYGYALADPNRLIMWEAQFGDFANGAQVIIDQFIASGHSKWGRMTGIVLLLPHGYEGQGPEHSNAWLGRYLSLCAEDNLQVINPSTPAQYFHVLRRQIKRTFRRPLIVMTPKSLLRHPRCVSPIADLSEGTFREILDDPRQPVAARRVVFCSGKIYYDLVQELEESGIDDVALVRVEQFYPINDDLWEDLADKYLDAREWVWASEEPCNFGAWSFMQENLACYYDGPIWYIGRARSASPATGSLSMHKHQQRLIIQQALQPKSLEPDLIDGVAVFTRGEELWHMKSKSRHSESRLAKAPSHSG